MTSVKLDFPALVQLKKYKQHMHYFIRPLFQEEPVCIARRYDKAIRKLQKEVRRSFNDIIINRDNLNSLLWFMFNPDINFEILNLSFEIFRFLPAALKSHMDSHIRQCHPQYTTCSLCIRKSNMKKHIYIF